MKKKFDKNDVLKFLYGELSPADHDDFVEALCCDDELFEAFEELKSAQEDLGEPELLEPSEESLDAIMDFVHTTTRPSVRERVTAIGVSGKKSPLFGTAQLVSTLMVCFTIGLIWFSVKLYGGQKGPEQAGLATELDWDSQSLTDRLERARLHLNNLADDRAVPYPVHHNTYRLVNSNLFTPAAQGVVFLNIR